MRRKFTTWKEWLAGAAILLFLNLYIFVNRQQGYGYRNFVSYPELYVVSESPYIKNLSFAGDTVRLVINGISKEASNRIQIDSGMYVAARWTGEVLSFPMQPDIRHYQWLIDTPGSSRNPNFVIDYATAGKSAGLNELNYSSLPFPERRPFSVKTWSMQTGLLNDPAKKQDAMQILNQRIPGFSNLADSQKIRSIANVVATTNGPLGGPPFSFGRNFVHWPDSMYYYVKDAQYRMNCGEISFLAAWFLVSAGYDVRSVAFKDGHPGWSHPVHYFLEIFDAAKGRWYLYDPLNEFLAPLKANGEYLNTVQLQEAFLFDPELPGVAAWDTNPDSPGVKAMDYWKDRLAQYFSYENQPISYNTVHDGKHATTFSRAVDFYTLPHTEMVYSKYKRNNWGKIALKLIAFYGFWYFLIVGIFRYRKYRREREDAVN